MLNKAILEGYHTLLTIGRFPICYINIEMDPILVDVNVHPTKLEVRLSKEEQLYQLIVSKIQEAFKDRILIPKNNLDYVPKKIKVLHSFEQQKIELNKDKTQRITKRRRSSEESNSKPFMEENQNDEIVIKEDSYNPFVTKTSESLIADDESSGYNNTREKDEDYFKKQQEILQEMDQTLIQMMVQLCKIMRIKRLMIIMM